MAGRIIDTLSVLIRMRKTGDGTAEAKEELQGLQEEAHTTKDAVGGITAALGAIGGLQFISGAVAQIESLDQVVGIVNSRLHLQRGEIDQLKASFLEMERYVPLDALAQLSGELVRAGDTAEDVEQKMQSAVRLMRIGPDLSATGTGRAISYLKALFPDEDLRTIEDDIANAIRSGLDLEDLISEGKFLQFAHDAGTDLGEALMLAAQAQVVGGGGALEDLMRLMSAPEADHRELLAAVGVDVEQLAGLATQGDWSRVAELLNQLDTGDLEAVVSSEGVAAIKRFIDLGSTLDETLLASRSNVGIAAAMAGRITDVESLGEAKDVMQTLETEVIESMDAGIELLRPGIDKVNEWLERIYGGDNEALEHAVTVAGATGSILVAIGVSNALLRGILTRMGLGGAGGMGGRTPVAGGGRPVGGGIPTATGMPAPTAGMPAGRFRPWGRVAGMPPVPSISARDVWTEGLGNIPGAGAGGFGLMGGLGSVGTIAAVGGTTAVGLAAAHVMEKQANEVAERIGVSVDDDYDRIMAAVHGGPEGLAAYDASQSRLSTPGMPGPIGPMTYRPYGGYESPSLRMSGPYPRFRPDRQYVDPNAYAAFGGFGGTSTSGSTPGMWGPIGGMASTYGGYESPSLRASGPYPRFRPDRQYVDPNEFAGFGGFGRSGTSGSTPGMWGPVGGIPAAGRGVYDSPSLFRGPAIVPPDLEYMDPSQYMGMGGFQRMAAILQPGSGMPGPFGGMPDRYPYRGRRHGDPGGGALPNWLQLMELDYNPINRTPHADRMHGPGGFGTFDWMADFGGYGGGGSNYLAANLDVYGGYSGTGRPNPMAGDLDVYGGYGAPSPFDVRQGPGYAPPDVMVENHITFNIPNRDDDAELADMIVAKTEETINRNFFQAVWDAATGRRK